MTSDRPKSEPPTAAADAARYRVALAEQELANAKAALRQAFKVALVELCERYRYRLGTDSRGHLEIYEISDPTRYTIQDLNAEISE